MAPPSSHLWCSKSLSSQKLSKKKNVLDLVHFKKKSLEQDKTTLVVFDLSGGPVVEVELEGSITCTKLDDDYFY